MLLCWREHVLWYDVFGKSLACDCTFCFVIFGSHDVQQCWYYYSAVLCCVVLCWCVYVNMFCGMLYSVKVWPVTARFVLLYLVHMICSADIIIIFIQHSVKKISNLYLKFGSAECCFFLFVFFSLILSLCSIDWSLQLQCRF